MHYLSLNKGDHNIINCSTCSVQVGGVCPLKTEITQSKCNVGVSIFPIKEFLTVTLQQTLQQKRKLSL